MLDVAESTIYEFDDFRFVAKSRRLNRLSNGEYVLLQPKAAELLLFLLTNDGTLLSKDKILDVVWGDKFVEESNLSQTIFVLRKALGENSKKPQFILTVPNRGYQFIASVRQFIPEDQILEDSILSDSQLEISESEFRIPNSNPKSKIQN